MLLSCFEVQVYFCVRCVQLIMDINVAVGLHFFCPGFLLLDWSNPAKEAGVLFCPQSKLQNFDVKIPNAKRSFHSTHFRTFYIFVFPTLCFFVFRTFYIFVFRTLYIFIFRTLYILALRKENHFFLFGKNARKLLMIEIP